MIFVIMCAMFCFCFLRSFLASYDLNALYDSSGVCAVFLTCAQVMGLTVVNVGGLDIIDGNHKMTLAIMWQLMRRHTLNLLQVQCALKYSGKCLPSRH